MAIKRHDLDAIKALLAAGNSTETTIDYGEQKMKPLIKAAWDSDADIVYTLLAAGAKLDAKATDTGETALMNAVRQGNAQIVTMLLKAGADLSAKNKFGFNAFTQAVSAGHQDIAGLLLDRRCPVPSRARSA